jgi:hypothetical protein
VFADLLAGSLPTGSPGPEASAHRASTLAQRL